MEAMKFHKMFLSAFQDASSEWYIFTSSSRNEQGDV